MNWEKLEADWNQVKGKVKERWGKLTDDELTEIKGKKDQLVSLVQQKYSITKEDAEKQLQELTRGLL